jgi:hypothetical protein
MLTRVYPDQIRAYPDEPLSICATRVWRRRYIIGDFAWRRYIIGDAVCRDVDALLVALHEGRDTVGWRRRHMEAPLDWDVAELRFFWFFVKLKKN